MKIHVLILAATGLLASVADAFSIPPPTSRLVHTAALKTQLSAKHSEFSVAGEDDEEETVEPSDFIVVDTTEEEEDAPASIETEDEVPSHKRFEYAALFPRTATTLQIQVGDLNLARKAWKKRRRSGSPLLVPCSVLNLDHSSSLRGNLMYLLYKFGTPQKDGVVLSVDQLKRRYKSHLQGQLTKHTEALGHESPRELIEALFQTRATQDNYGVRLLTQEGELFLKSPLSKYRALQKAAQATLLQVITAEDTLKHTGYIRCKADPEQDKPYRYPPLSAAIRVSKEDSAQIQQGSLHPAVFFDFDAQGDGGSPLLTLSLNPAARRATPAAAKSSRNSGKTHPKYTPIRSPRHLLGDLKVGDGPFEAKVVRLIRDHALVDFGVGRQFSSQDDPHSHIGTPEFVKVYGMLRFKDAIDTQRPQSAAPVEDEDDVFRSMEELLNKVDDLDKLEEGEEAEDITHLFNLNDDGSLRYDDPETGETEIVNSEEEEDGPVTFDISHSKRLQRPRTIRLRVGDRYPVHIKSVSKQSSQFAVTTDPSTVRGKKAKDIKKENDVSKKLERLSQMLGGLDKAEELRGREYDGTVKATSQTGDWLYVQPQGDDLPVGVATIPDELASEIESSSFAQGDLVRIQLDGIDESRGQLAMRVIEKLSP